MRPKLSILCLNGGKLLKMFNKFFTRAYVNMSFQDGVFFGFTILELDIYLG